MVKFLKEFFCGHLFDPPDMKTRDKSGMVEWPCCKCGRVFRDTCGLYIIYAGRCTGNWVGKKQ